MTTFPNTSTPSNRYKAWNDALAARFFNEAMDGRNVHLYVNQDLITEVGQGLPGAGNFPSAIAGHPQAPTFKGEQVCNRAYRDFRRWKTIKSEFPPYIGYLCLFVLASGTEGDFASNAYYPRLWTLMGYSGRTGRVPDFEHMSELWDDLENWSVYEKQGELGIFHSRSIGGFVHVGYPLSQAILVESERQVLPLVFYEARLDPASTHPAGEIAMALRGITAKQELRPRTVRIAESPQDELHTALTETVREELAAWDGKVTDTGPGISQQTETLAGLRLCIELDSVARIVKSSIRCKLNHEYPEAGLLLDRGLLAEEDVNGWSLPVTTVATGAIFDASELDWWTDVTMRCTSLGYRLRLKGYPVRIFTNAMPEGISGLVDTPTLPSGQSFYLCYPEAAWSRLEKWATTQCQGFQDLKITQGLPKSWRLARVEAAIGDEAVPSAFTTLTFQSGLRLLLAGGIRSGNGNNFFNFAPPAVVLVGGASDTAVYCNDELLSSQGTDGVYPLPEDLLIGTRINIEARSAQSTLAKQSLFLTSDFGLLTGEPEMLVDFTGRSINPCDGIASISGVYIKGPGTALAMSGAEEFEDLEFEIGRIQGFLLGPRPGQIVSWPSETFPSNWTPTWAVTKRGPKKWAALFIGEMLEETSVESTVIPTHRKIKKWKEVTWHWRKRILLPELPDQKTLWRQIQEAARRV